jgi:cell fate regulator YaaT (PSP1 superfamily)
LALLTKFKNTRLTIGGFNVLLAKLHIRKSKNIVYADQDNVAIKQGDLVILQTENDLEIGTVINTEKEIPVEKDKEIYKVVRKCTPKDLEIISGNESKLKDYKLICLTKIQEQKLEMKLTAMEYTFNRDKLFIYYTADGRIDFRELIKELGLILKTKIQMVQIGVRDETKIVGAIGQCGRILCCKNFMNDLKPVVIDMAKEQGLSLNPTKISGVCGRLICCLGFENDYYKEISKIMPDENDEVLTPDGLGKVKAKYVLKEEVEVLFEDGSIKRYKANILKIKHRAPKCEKDCGKHCSKKPKEKLVQPISEP